MLFFILVFNSATISSVLSKSLLKVRKKCPLVRDHGRAVPVLTGPLLTKALSVKAYAVWLPKWAKVESYTIPRSKHEVLADAEARGLLLRSVQRKRIKPQCYQPQGSGHYLYRLYPALRSFLIAMFILYKGESLFLFYRFPNFGLLACLLSILIAYILP